MPSCIYIYDVYVPMSIHCSQAYWYCRHIYIYINNKKNEKLIINIIMHLCINLYVYQGIQGPKTPQNNRIRAYPAAGFFDCLRGPTRHLVVK